MDRQVEMRFSKRMLVAITVIGVAIGLHEAWRLTGGLVVLMALQMLVLGIACVALVRKIREERQ